MRLPKEIDLSWAKTIALTWAFFWRMLVISIPVSIFIGYLQRSGENMRVYAALFQIVSSLIALVLVFRWLFRNGSFGSIRLILMEQSDFQELVERLENSREKP